MKTRIVVFLISLFALTSCDEELTVDVDAIFNSEITAEAVETPLEGVVSKSASMYNFMGERLMNIEDDEDVKEHIERIREVNISSVEFVAYGIPEGEMIKTLKLEIESTSFVKNYENLSSENSSFVIDLSDLPVNEVEKLLADSHEIKIKISGETTTAPMSIVVRLKFITVVSAALIK